MKLIKNKDFFNKKNLYSQMLWNENNNMPLSVFEIVCYNRSGGQGIMATMNLLQGSVRGSIGNETGVRSKGRNVMKKKIWSKTPPNQTQTNCVRSFESLNRISSAVARKYWYWLGWRQGNMHKHNVVASKFSVCIQNHEFTPSLISEVIPSGNAFDVRDFRVDMVAHKVAVDVVADLPLLNEGLQSACVMVFDGAGHVHLCERMKSPLFVAEFESELAPVFPYYFMAFSSTKEKGKITLQNFHLQMTLPENVFYTENYPKIRWWTVQPDYLYGEGEGLSTSDDVLVVDGSIG